MPLRAGTTRPAGLPLSLVVPALSGKTKNRGSKSRPTEDEDSRGGVPIMAKLRIEKRASRVRRIALKTTIDGTVADDIELLCKWSENDTSYVVNQLLGFAVSQSEDFQQYKQSLESNASIATEQTAPRSVTATPKAAALPVRNLEAEK
jgi:hypothetical protein